MELQPSTKSAEPPADLPVADRSVRQWVHWAEQQMTAAEVVFGHGTDNARDEAVWLVSHALSMDPATLGCHAQRRPGEAQAGRIETLIRRRIEERLPAAYLTGQAWFAGLEMAVGDGALVPRSPIAELIVDGLAMWPLASGDRVLDLCTGGGCIAVAMAVHFPEIAVEGADISGEALRIAERNVRKHRCEDRVRLLQGNLFQPIQSRFRLIISNPPYVATSEMASLPAEYRHEPAVALSSGDDGLDIPLRILSDAADYLEPGGDLILELGNSAETLAEQLPEVPLTWLEFASGGHGVLTITAEELEQYRPAFQACARRRRESHVL